uniref:Uncharacterized protein n=1 Tax=Utricularia reniformis TaxID=192314 RepID=A0A1Y0B2X9_9LAMI|nr:hypothetical protein AEK19_MT1546 [Utricularia reniformis]ART31733.1 hypothetical protein AEK19_MT1546 [Utricularia reniformis]
MSEPRLIIERAEAAWLYLSSKASCRLRKIRIMRLASKVENSKVKGASY